MFPLSKSKLMAFRQCPKRLWLEVHRQELMPEQGASNGMFAGGLKVGEIARQIYDPSGKGVLAQCGTDAVESALARTAEAIASSASPVFEAGFEAGGGIAFADILLRDGEGWTMIEVKSAASVKDHHRDDVAVQGYIARTAGVPLNAVLLAHIDSSWVYPGDGDYNGLLTTHDVTSEVASRTREVADWIAAAHEVVKQTAEPAVEVGAHCSSPHPCAFAEYCHRDLHQPEYPLDWLPRLSAKKREELLAAGIVDLRDAPEDRLSPKQAMVRRQSLSKEAYFDAAGAAAELARYQWPAYFLDFEGIGFAVPIWKGTRPYQQLPFQFSLHRRDEDGTLTHSEFVDLSGNDPSPALAEKLVAGCGSSGPVYVYNAKYEAMCLQTLAERVPELAESLKSLRARLVDLLPIAERRYYHPAQCGKWSLKNVLPTIAPEFSYHTLAVQNGGMAMAVFAEAIQPGTSTERRAEIEQGLLRYCELDTLALVKVWEFFSGRRGA